MTKDPEDILQKNWYNKIEQLKQSIHFWKTLPISLVGKIDAIKMIALPRFLHLFQSLPCYIAQYYFKQLDSIIVPFIWNYKVIRISKKNNYVNQKMLEALPYRILKCISGRLICLYLLGGGTAPPPLLILALPGYA